MTFTVNIQPILDIMPKDDRKRSNLCDLFAKQVSEIVKWRQSLNLIESPVHKMIRPIIQTEIETIDARLEELMTIINLCKNDEMTHIDTETLTQEGVKNMADVLETLKETYSGVI